MDHSEEDKRFYVYVHKDACGNIRYVGSGVAGRFQQRSGRSPEHLQIWDSLIKEKFVENLSKTSASEKEVELINTLWDSNLLFNKRRNSTLAKPVIYNEIKDLLEYDETSPSFLRIKGSNRGKAVIGDVAGYLSRAGYWVCCVNYKTYKVHRLIFSLQNKQDVPPNLFVDHIDRNRNNNSISNLRLVTPQSNCGNREDIVNAEYIHTNWDTGRKIYLMRVYSANSMQSDFVTKSFNPSVLFPNDPPCEANRKTLVLINYTKQFIEQEKELCSGNLDTKWIKNIAFSLVKRNRAFTKDISIYQQLLKETTYEF